MNKESRTYKLMVEPMVTHKWMPMMSAPNGMADLTANLHIKHRFNDETLTKIIQFDVVPMVVDVVTTKMKVGVGVGASELYSIGGFTFDWSGGLRFAYSRISGSDSVCTYEVGNIVGVSPGTCIYSIKLASYDGETKETGPWETKVIQFDVT